MSSLRGLTEIVLEGEAAKFQNIEWGLRRSDET